MTHDCLSLIRQSPSSFKSLRSCCGKACVLSFCLVIAWYRQNLCLGDGVQINCTAKCSHLSVEHPLQCLCQTNNDRKKPTFCTGFLLAPFAEKNDCCFFKSWELTFAATAFQLLNKLWPWAAVRQILHYRLQLKGAPDKHFSA